MILIRDYDELKNHLLKLRSSADNQAKTAVDPATKSFSKGLVYAYDQIFVAMLSWEKFCQDNPER